MSAIRLAAYVFFCCFFDNVFTRWRPDLPCDLISLSLGPQNWECENQVYMFLELMYLMLMPLKQRGLKKEKKSAVKVLTVMPTSVDSGVKLWLENILMLRCTNDY